MQPDLVREISELIVRDQLLLNWKFYFLVAAIGSLAGVAGYWVAPYLKKRAETFATKADMEEVLRQVAQTTRATEEVKSAFSRADWATREWRTIRRIKLEELLSSAYALGKWLETHRSKWLHASDTEVSDEPMDRITVLATLYFPDLKPEADVVVTTHRNALMYILEMSKEPRNAKLANDTAAYTAGLDKFTEGWMPNYAATRVALAALEAKASAAMAEFASV